MTLTNQKLLLEIEKTDHKIIQLQAEETETVSSILFRLQEEFGLSKKYSLVFKFKELRPDRTLKSYLIGAQRGTRLSLNVFERRDELKQIEAQMQKLWLNTKVFQENAPTRAQRKGEKSPPKFFATFPFPYVNGLLHCGHGFSLSKAEFSCGFQRLLGKQVLLPFGFHCTGMPIVASANRLKKEIAQYGNPPVFPVEKEKSEQIQKQKEAFGKKKKGKLAGKKSKQIYQYEIMRELGIPEEEIHEFADPHKWVKYFTPKCFEDLRKFGCKIDARRSFITTDMNPFFSRFVEWQFNFLKKRGIVRFGKRMCIFSPAENQPCADHDRSSGEGVQPQEYTAIKLRLLSTRTTEISQLIPKDSDTFLVAGTLRPETMYGQTNCFVKPNGDYVLIETAFKNEHYICSEKSAKNMSFQNQTALRGKPKIVAHLRGWDLLGAAVEAPNAMAGRIFVLPLPGISMEKATAVVTSVPSDSPEDYVNYSRLQSDQAYRAKYHITEEMVAIPITPIISIPGYTNLAAEDVVKKLNITSPDDEKKLRLAKEKIYLHGFYKGVLTVGPHKGIRVEEAKDEIKAALIAEGKAFRYFEPEEAVVSRSGEVCVVAETNQWFLHYGEEPFKSLVESYVRENMDFYSLSTKNRFLETIDWMKQWACSRKFGLGTKLPFDKEWLIESLSDSTIYMAYYTIAHFLDSKISVCDSDERLDIPAEALTDEVLNAIFLGGEVPSQLQNDLTEENVLRMRNEFTYWYPLDLRVSGKDLINNHLVMCLYNHAFLWPQANWPRSMFANGHALINAEKMSKSTGNFLTLAECIAQYGADATRLAFADAGDGLDDANFAPETCNAAIIRLTKELNWIKAAHRALAANSTGSQPGDGLSLRNSNAPPSRDQIFADQIFSNEIRQAVADATAAFSRMKFRVALNKGFYFLCSSRNNYVSMCAEEGLNKDLVAKFIEMAILLLAPICSHWSEFLWRHVGGKGLLFAEGRWPSEQKADRVLARQSQYLRESGQSVRQALRETRRRRAKAGKLFCSVFVAASHPPRRLKVIEAIKAFAASEGVDLDCVGEDARRTFSRGALEMLKASCAAEKGLGKKGVKEAMQFGSFVLGQTRERGAKALEVSLGFDEKELLGKHWQLVLQDMAGDIESVEVFGVGDIDKAAGSARKELLKCRALQNVTPGRIGVFFSENKIEFE